MLCGRLGIRTRQPKHHQCEGLLGGENRRISFIIVKGCRRINISTIALAYIFETLRLTLINFSHYRFLCVVGGGGGLEKLGVNNCWQNGWLVMGEEKEFFSNCSGFLCEGIEFVVYRVDQKAQIL